MKEIFISPKIKVKPSSLHGMGVFAIEPIQKEEIIEVCYCIIDKPPINLNSIIKKYIFSENRIVFGYGSIYNHSFEPNLTWEVSSSDNRFIEFKAIKNIEIGEELTHCYTKHKEHFEKWYL